MLEPQTPDTLLGDDSHPVPVLSEHRFGFGFARRHLTVDCRDLGILPLSIISGPGFWLAPTYRGKAISAQSRDSLKTNPWMMSPLIGRGNPAHLDLQF